MKFDQGELPVASFTRGKLPGAIYQGQVTRDKLPGNFQPNNLYSEHCIGMLVF